MVLVVAERAVPQRGHQTGVQQRGLPRPRRAHEHDQATRPGHGPELRDERVRAPLPAEEPPGVLPPVGGQPPVRAHPAGRGRGLGRSLVLLRGPVRAFGDRVGHRALPQPLPLPQVVQARRHRCGPLAPRLGDQHVQHRREGGELGGHVPGPPPVADALGGHPYGPPAFVDPLEPHHRFGHTFEWRVARFLVQQCEAFREGGACPRVGTQGLHSSLPTPGRPVRKTHSIWLTCGNTLRKPPEPPPPRPEMAGSGSSSAPIRSASIRVPSEPDDGSSTVRYRSPRGEGPVPDDVVILPGGVRPPTPRPPISDPG